MNKQKKKSLNHPRNNEITILPIVIIVISLVIFLATNYYKKTFAGQKFEALLYNLNAGIKVANLEIIKKGILASIIPFIILLVIFLNPIFTKSKNVLKLHIQSKKKSKEFRLYPLKNNFKTYIIYSLTIFIIVILTSLSRIGAFEYWHSQSTKSTIFEEYYVPSNKVKLTFPENKRNLVFIFMESMEASLFTESNGGGYPYSLIPELEKLALENTNFSDSNKLGGAMQVQNTGWTVSGMVAQTSGIPLKLNIDGNSYNGYKFLPGVYSLGDILEKEGYNLEIMMGSDANFGGRKDYFQNHGHYKIYDLEEAIARGKMNRKDIVWWGFSDDNLFKWSKEEILDLASQDRPFNYVLLTADTHFTDGYLSKKAPQKYTQRYENVHAYSSKLVYEFVEWLQQQDFYKNTTIVLVGDHLGMQTEFYDQNLKPGYERRVYNAFVNPAIPAQNNHNRKFSTLDIFPTILASIDVKIEGNRLGLGTNLYSGKKTLIEELGFDNFNEQIANKSDYYNKEIIKDDYKKLLDAETKENAINNQ